MQTPLGCPDSQRLFVLTDMTYIFVLQVLSGSGIIWYLLNMIAISVHEKLYRLFGQVLEEGASSSGVV